MPKVGILSDPIAHNVRAAAPEYTILTEAIFDEWRADIVRRYAVRDPTVVYYLSHGAIPVPTPNVEGGFIGIVPYRGALHKSTANVAVDQFIAQLCDVGLLAQPTPRSFSLATPPTTRSGVLASLEPYHRSFRLNVSPREGLTTYLEGLPNVPMKTMKIEILDDQQLHIHQNLQTIDLRRAAAFAFRLCEDVDVLIDSIAYKTPSPEHFILGMAHGAVRRFGRMKEDPYDDDEPVVAVSPNQPGDGYLMLRLYYHSPKPEWLFYLRPSFVARHIELLNAHLSLSWPPGSANAHTSDEINEISSDVYLTSPGGMHHTAAHARWLSHHRGWY